MVNIANNVLVVELDTLVYVAPAVIEPGLNIAGILMEGDYQYYQSECPSFSDSPLVEVRDIQWALPSFTAPKLNIELFH